jgi:hypothetical protein
MSCFTVEELLERLLGDAQGDAAVLHAAECPECGRLLDELGEMTGALASLRGAEPPQEVVAKAVALQPRRRWRDRVVELVRAALVLDSATLAPVPVRSQIDSVGAGGAAARYLRFETGSWAAELHLLRAENERNDLAGRLLQPEGEAPFAVLARGSHGFSYPRMSDELGHFHFPELPPDRYELVLELDGADLVLAPVELA